MQCSQPGLLGEGGPRNGESLLSNRRSSHLGLSVHCVSIQNQKCWGNALTSNTACDPVAGDNADSNVQAHMDHQQVCHFMNSCKFVEHLQAVSLCNTTCR